MLSHSGKIWFRLSCPHGFSGGVTKISREMVQAEQREEQTGKNSTPDLPAGKLQVSQWVYVPNLKGLLFLWLLPPIPKPSTEYIEALFRDPSDIRMILSDVRGNNTRLFAQCLERIHPFLPRLSTANGTHMGGKNNKTTGTTADIHPAQLKWQFLAFSWFTPVEHLSRNRPTEILCQCHSLAKLSWLLFNLQLSQQQ